MNELLPAAIFLAINWGILYLILRDNRPKTPDFAEITRLAPGQGTLDPAAILALEYDYIKTTASEAMQDRHTMVNFYLLVAGGVATGSITILSGDGDLWPLATLLLWLFCGIGWLYFLKLVQLRRAWGGSAAAMAQVKEFCIVHAQQMDPEIFRQAFLWTGQTIPPLAGRWTVFFYSAMLIAYIDSVAFVSGALILLGGLPNPGPLAVLLGIGVLFFFLHVWFYKLLLPASDK